MPKGDVVLISFPFTDLSGSKLRPAAILAETDLDLTICFITTQLQWQEAADVQLLPTTFNVLRKQSLIRKSKIAKVFAKGLLGELKPNEITDFNNKLKMLFQLP